VGGVAAAAGSAIINAVDPPRCLPALAVLLSRPHPVMVYDDLEAAPAR
jgi:hypothetical protein